MAFENIIADHNAFVLGFDDVVYPEKDYLLQVYYLFAEFMAYSEQLDAEEILSFLKNEYKANGSASLFHEFVNKFGVSSKYEENFVRLHANARLPLKLLLFKQVLMFLQEIVVERGAIFLVLEGDPEVQINKIKQIEWNGLEQYLKLYFTQEFNSSIVDTVNFIASENDLSRNKMVFLGKDLSPEIQNVLKPTQYIEVRKLLSN